MNATATEPVPKLPEARADAPARSYRILKLDHHHDDADPCWLDLGPHAGSRPDEALERAAGKHPEAEIKTKGTVVVAVPETHWSAFSPEVIESVAWKKKANA